MRGLESVPSEKLGVVVGIGGPGSVFFPKVNKETDLRLYCCVINVWYCRCFLALTSAQWVKDTRMSLGLPLALQKPNFFLSHDICRLRESILFVSCTVSFFML